LVSPEEIETIAITQDILWVKLTDHRAVPIAVHTFRSIRRQQWEQQSQPEADVAFVMDLEAKLEVDTVKVDQVNGVYHVWHGMNLMGEFRRCAASSNWVGELAHLSVPYGYESALCAPLAVVETYNWFTSPVRAGN